MTSIQELLILFLRFEGYTKGSGVQWPFSNKVSALPHLMSFKVGQEDKTRRTMPESIMSSGFGPFATADAFDQCQKRPILEFQVCIVLWIYLIYMFALLVFS